MTRTIALFACLAVGSGCGGNFCKQSEKLAESCGGAYDAGDAQACKDGMDKCDAADEKAMINYLDCYENSGICGADANAQSLDAAFACLGELTGLSQECLGGFVAAG